MKTMHMAIFGTALCVLASVPALAADTNGGGMNGRHRGEFFKMMDTNGDGVISKDEYMAAAEARFKKLDANGDGKLTKKEMMEAYKERRKQGM